jgi:hypothetical protein
MHGREEKVRWNKQQKSNPMKARTKRCLELLDRVSEFFSEHPTLTFGTRGIALIAEVNTTRNAMRSQGASQVSGFGEFRGGVADRRALAAELLAQIREIEMAAEAMDSLSAPVPAEQLQRPQSESYQALLDTATAFVTVLTPLTVQQAFIDRDFPADFVTQLSALATQFAEATARKYAGRQTQKSGTLGVDQSAQQGLAIVKELNSILTKKLRKTDPVLLGVWRAASRLEQSRRPEPNGPHDENERSATLGLIQDSENLGERPRMLVSPVAGGHDEFGSRRVEMAARVGHDAVAALRDGPAAATVADNAVHSDPRSERLLIHDTQDRMVRGKRVDAGEPATGKSTAECRPDCVRIVPVQPRMEPGESVWQSGEDVPDSPNETRRHFAPAMRHGNENDMSHVAPWLPVKDCFDLGTIVFARA